MNTSEMGDRIAELETQAGREEGRMFGKVLDVKIRVRCGDEVRVIDLEPGMLSAKGWGSGDEKKVLLLDLS